MRTAIALAVVAALAVPAAAVAAPPANDDLADAQAIAPTLPATVTGTNVGATGVPGETIYSPGNVADASVWFAWTAPRDATVVVDECAPIAAPPEAYVDRQIAVYTGGNTWDSLTETAGTGGKCQVSFDATAGVTYKIQADFAHGGEFGFSLTLRELRPPANDDFADAQDLGTELPVAVPGSTVDASGEPGEPAELGVGGRRTVWYSWTAPLSGQVQVSACDFETLPGFAKNRELGVYTGEGLSGLTQVAAGKECTLLVSVTEGSEYKIAFSGTSDGQGTFTLRIISAAPPANDAFSGRSPVGPDLPLTVEGNNTFATAEAGEPNVGGRPSDDSLWYRWTAPKEEVVRVNACSAGGPMQLSVFTGSSLGSLHEVGGHTPGSYCKLLLYPAEAGTEYSIAVAGGGTYETAGGPFLLDMHVYAPPPNDDLARALTIGPEMPIAVSANNSDATAESGEPPFSPGQAAEESLWYRWVSPIDGTVQVAACGSWVAPAIFTGLPVPDQLTRVGAVTDLTPCAAGTLGWQQQLDAVAGATYWIAVESLQVESGGPFTLTVVDPNASPGEEAPPGPGAGPTLPGAGAPVLPGAPGLPVGGPTTTHAPGAPKPTAQTCRERFPVKGGRAARRKARRKRADCARKARRKAALARCHRIGRRAARRRCARRVRHGYARHRQRRSRHQRRHGHGR